MRSGSNGNHALTLPRVWREAEMEGRERSYGYPGMIYNRGDL